MGTKTLYKNKTGIRNCKFLSVLSFKEIRIHFNIKSNQICFVQCTFKKYFDQVLSAYVNNTSTTLFKQIPLFCTWFKGFLLVPSIQILTVTLFIPRSFYVTKYYRLKVIAQKLHKQISSLKRSTLVFCSRVTCRIYSLYLYKVYIFKTILLSFTTWIYFDVFALMFYKERIYNLFHRYESLKSSARCFVHNFFIVKCVFTLWLKI